MQQNNRKILLALYVRLEYSEGIQIFPALDTEPCALFCFTLLYTASMPPCKMVFTRQSFITKNTVINTAAMPQNNIIYTTHISLYSPVAPFHSNTKFSRSCDRRKPVNKWFAYRRRMRGISVRRFVAKTNAAILHDILKKNRSINVTSFLVFSRYSNDVPERRTVLLLGVYILL